MSNLSDHLGSNLESQLGKVFSASVEAMDSEKGVDTINEFASSLGIEPSQAGEVAQQAIDGIISQTLKNIGMERTEELEAKFWNLNSLERASIATRLISRDTTVFKELKQKLQ